MFVYLNTLHEAFKFQPHKLIHPMDDRPSRGAAGRRGPPTHAALQYREKETFTCNLKRNSLYQFSIVSETQSTAPSLMMLPGQHQAAGGELDLIPTELVALTASPHTPQTYRCAQGWWYRGNGHLHRHSQKPSLTRRCQETHPTNACFQATSGTAEGQGKRVWAGSGRRSRRRKTRTKSREREGGRSSIITWWAYSPKLQCSEVGCIFLV